MQGLPLKAFEEIPEAKNDAKEIIALVKDQGKVTGYQLSSGETVDKEQGDIANVTEDNNLGNLPAVSDKTE